LTGVSRTHGASFWPVSWPTPTGCSRRRGRSARDSKPGSPADKAVETAAGLLVSLLQQDIERREDGPALVQGVAKDRIVSATDPEMRHGHKSKSNLFCGHKAAIAVEADSGIITALEVLPGNAPDSTKALALVEATERATGLDVEETIADCAYGDPGTRQDFGEAGRKLIAKVPAAHGNGLFTKQDFTIDPEAGTCQCPAGKKTSKLVAGRKLLDARERVHVFRVFQFSDDDCRDCPLRSQCTHASTRGRTIQLHPQEAELAAARELQRSAEFATYRYARQVVEHRFARLRQLGARQSRFFGRRKTRFQLLMAAAAANLTLVWSAPERAGRAGVT
jgi:hypothetical protein